MKLDFDNYPLDVYNQTSSKSILKSIGRDVPNLQREHSPIINSVLSSFVNKAAGAGLLSFVDSISIGLNGKTARKCLSRLIQAQTIRVKRNPSEIIKEAQLNLMASSCITDYLSYLESGSFGNAGKNMVRSVVAIIKNFSLRSGLEELGKAVCEVCDKYDSICQVYHIAFLLTIYNSNPSTEGTIRKLITESLCDDSEGESSFSSKKRPVLFSNVQYKSLGDNLKNRINILSDEAKNDSDLYDPFVKHRIKLNEEYK